METQANNTHFQKISDEYRKSLEGPNKIVYQNIRTELEQRLSGSLVDIGNGGVFNYDTAKLESISAVDPNICGGARENEATKKIEFLRTIASDMHAISSNSMDQCLMQFIIHHIVAKNNKLTNEELSKSFTEIYRIMKPSGKLIIVEMVTYPFIEWLESILFRLTRLMFSLMHKPMVKFYSKGGLRRILMHAGFRVDEMKMINMGKSFDILGGWAPGIITMPSSISPLKCVLVSASKP